MLLNVVVYVIDEICWAVTGNDENSIRLMRNRGVIMVKPQFDVKTNMYKIKLYH
jgi:hypothetical protein